MSLRKQVPVEMTDKPTAYRHIHRLNHATTRHGALRRHNEHRLYTPRNDPPAWRDIQDLTSCSVVVSEPRQPRI